MFKVNNKDTRMTPLAETVNCIITIERGGLLGKRGATFSRGCRFYIKNKLIYEIFNNKSLLKRGGGFLEGS